LELARKSNDDGIHKFIRQASHIIFRFEHFCLDKHRQAFDLRHHFDAIDGHAQFVDVCIIIIAENCRDEIVNFALEPAIIGLVVQDIDSYRSQRCVFAVRLSFYRR